MKKLSDTWRERKPNSFQKSVYLRKSENIQSTSNEKLIHSGDILKENLNPNVNYGFYGNERITDPYVAHLLPSDAHDISSIGPKQQCKERRDFDNIQNNILSSQYSELPSTSLSSWNLPEAVLQAYEAQGISTIFQWQLECLTLDGVLDGRNIVFSAPTSAGKTLVADIIVLKRCLELDRKALYILPYVSVAKEKSKSLRGVYGGIGLRVGGFMGGEQPAGGFAACNIAVCTIEKANSLVNKMLESGTLNELAVVVADELHMVGDSSRGYLLELLLTKLLYISKVGKNSNPIQIVGMSATLPNLNVISKWLNAALYTTTFRPVPLVQFVKLGEYLYSSEMKKVSDVVVQTGLTNDEDNVVSLCVETLINGHSVLVFCPSKARCEKVANIVASGLICLRKNSVLEAVNLEELYHVVDNLKHSPVGLDKSLITCLQSGVCYHHAGLSTEERDIIERGFRNGSIRVLVATSTLSSGVNLPARRVIIRTPTSFNGGVIDTLSYQQMVGRAGRKGVDSAGESILICKPTEKAKAMQLLTKPLQPVKSCLVIDNDNVSTSLKRAILEIIVSGVASTKQDVSQYVSSTLLATGTSTTSQTHVANNIGKCVDNCLRFLIENEFIRAGDSESLYYPTQLGQAVLASSMNPDEAIKVFVELQRARRCFVLDSELHTVYQVTPIYAYDVASSIDWYHYMCLYSNMSANYRRVADLVGVKESYIARAVQGKFSTKTVKHIHTAAVHRRFYTALILTDLINEVPLNVVSLKYKIPRGQLQSLQQSAASFAGVVSVFCNRLSWTNLELILSDFQPRLCYGVQRELCDLVRLNCINGQQARSLYSSGYKTIISLANEMLDKLEKAVIMSTPFASKRTHLDEDEFDVNDRRKASRAFWLSAFPVGSTELDVAKQIIIEARHIVESDAVVQGLVVPSWNDVVNETNSTKNISPSQIYAHNDSNINSVCNVPDQVGSVISNNVGSIKDKSSIKTHLETVTHQSNPAASPVQTSASTSVKPIQCINDVNSSLTSHVTLSTLIKCDTPNQGMNISSQKVLFSPLDNPFPIPTPANLNINFPIKSITPHNSNISDPPDKLSQSAVSPDLYSVPWPNEDKSDTSNTKSIDNVDDSLDFTPNVVRKSSQHADDNKSQNSKEFRKSEECIGNRSLSSSELSSHNPHIDELVSNSDHSLCFCDGNKNSFIESSNCSALSPTYPPPHPVYSPLLAPQHVTDQLLSESTFSFQIPQTSSQPICINMSIKYPVVDNSQLSESLLIKFEDSLVFTQELISDNDPDIEQQAQCSTAVSIDSSIVEDAINNSNKSSTMSPSSDSEMFNECFYTDITNNYSCINSNERSINHTGKTSRGRLYFQSPSCQSPSDQSPASKLQCCRITPKLGETSYKHSVFSDDISSPSQFTACNTTPGICQKSQIVSSKTQNENPSVQLLFETPKTQDFCDSFSDSDSDSLIPPTPPGELSALNVLPVRNGSLESSKVNCNASLKNNSHFKISQTHISDSKYTLTHLNTELTTGSVSPVQHNATTGINYFSDGITKMTPLKCLATRIKLSETPISTYTRSRRKSNHININTANTVNTDEVFTIIDVADNTELFDMFIEEWKSKDLYSVSVAVEKPKNISGVRIGQRCAPKEADEVGPKVVGMAVSWGSLDSYFISFVNRLSVVSNQVGVISRPEDPQWIPVSVPERLKAIRNVLSISGSSKIVFDFKEQLLILMEYCDVYIEAPCLDPKLASWLLEPSDKEKTFHSLITDHLPLMFYILHQSRIPQDKSTSSLGLTSTQSTGRIRSSVESVLSFHLMNQLTSKLHDENLYETFIDVETPVLRLLADLQRTGIGVSGAECEFQRSLLTDKLSSLESRAYSLVGPINLNNPMEVSRILYLHLNLPTNCNSNGSNNKIKSIKSKVIPREFSTSKEVVEKLVGLHPFPGVLLEWRRINSALTNIILPVIRCKQMDDLLNMERVRPDWSFCTATGRVVCSNPHLQQVLRDFSIVPDESAPTAARSRRLKGDQSVCVSLRQCFVAHRDCVLLSADYSQIELRVIAHLSGDPVLLEVLNSGRDVFKQIARRWKGVEESDVSEELRQQTKSVCYGIIYGISSASLSGKLEVTQSEAAAFITEFRRRFAVMDRFIVDSVEVCRANGFVSTLCGRRRYLPGVRSSNPSVRGHAERQSVNTRVQGSAADLVKLAMVRIDNNLRDLCSNGLVRLVLNMHDELVYEVRKDSLSRLAEIVRNEMENVLELSVKLIVKVKCGPTWGNLTPYPSE